MKSRLSDVPAAIRLSRASLRNIHENLFWAFIYNIIGIPLAAGAWIPLFGWTLNPMFGAAAMSLSSFCVVTNALRLNLFKMNDASRDRKLKNALGNMVESEGYQDLSVSNNIPGGNNMKEIIVGVEGMMCCMCEKHVNEAVSAAFDVEKVTSSHDKNETIILTKNEISEDQVKEVIKKAGYTVTSFSERPCE